MMQAMPNYSGFSGYYLNDVYPNTIVQTDTQEDTLLNEREYEQTLPVDDTPVENPAKKKNTIIAIVALVVLIILFGVSQR